jgi:hypothetical protein
VSEAWANDARAHDGHAEPIAPTPWRAEDFGLIVDARGEPIARLTTRLNQGDESWRAIAGKLARGWAAAELERALEELIDYTAEILGSPIMVGVEGRAADRLKGLDDARAALAKTRQR